MSSPSDVGVAPVGTALSPGGLRALLCRVGGRLCAIRLDEVVETMRPLSIEALSGLPPFVRGLAVVRGVPVPVVDLGALLGASEESRFGRFVTVRAGARCVALGVDDVLGVRPLPVATLEELPPLLRDASAANIEAVGSTDAQFLMVLRAARLVPEELWNRIEAAQAGAHGAQQ